MSDSNGKIVPVMTKLQNWVIANTTARASLNKPSLYEGMSDSARKTAQFENRNTIADSLVTEHFTKNVEFRGILNEVCSTQSAGSRRTHCSAVRDVLRELQEKAWAEYSHPSNARNRAKVLA